MDALAIKIRTARPKDLGEILRLLAILGDQDRPDPVTDRARKTLAKHLADPNRHILVADAKSCLAGTVDLLVQANLSKECSPRGQIENIVVDPAFRRWGVGRDLMQEAERIAKESGCYNIQLVSHAKRAGAHRLYEQMGYDVQVRGFRKLL